jgi:hypothetical protein
MKSRIGLVQNVNHITNICYGFAYVTIIAVRNNSAKYGKPQKWALCTCEVPVIQIANN